MHRWRCGRNPWTGRSLFTIFIIKKAGKSTRNTCLRVSGNTLFEFARVLIHKTKQYMVAAHALTYMPNAWMFPFHPDIDHCLKRGHAIPTLCAIKAFEPVHPVVLSASYDIVPSPYHAA